MHKRALLALMLVATMLLSGCALIEKDMNVDRATEIVKVGETVYTKGEVLDQIAYQLDYMAYMYSMFGMSYDPADPANIEQTTDEVINFMIEDAVKNQKVKELGLDTLTAEEQAELDAAVETAWQNNVDGCKDAYFAETELTGDELDAAVEAELAAMGVTHDVVVESEKIALTQDKLREYVIKDVAVTEEELQAAFDEQVESAKTNYETSLSSYGSSVNNGYDVYYRPAGYRMVKQILVQFSEEDKTAIDEMQAKVDTLNTTISNLYVTLSNLGVTDTVVLTEKVNVTLDENGEVASVDATFPEGTTEELAQMGQQLAEGLKQLDFFQAQLKSRKAAAFASIDAEADDIIAQLNAGADWDTLMAEKTDDPGMQGDSATAKNGYAVCENFTNFDTSFTNAAMALEKVGDISPKTEGSYGYYIIQYTSDVEEGPVALDDVRETLTASTLTTKQDTVFADTLAQWVAEADAKVDLNALNN